MKNRKVISIVLLFSLVLSLFTLPVLAASTPSSWAESEVNEAINADLVTSSVQANYQANITRKQFCGLVVKAYEKISGRTAEEGEVSFDDTDNSDILKAANLHIVTGYGNGSFGPNDLITREQIATMLVRMIHGAVPGENTVVYNNNNFADSDSISSWAVPSVNFAYDKNLMQGIGNNCIGPQENTTCEQAILLVYRAFVKYSAKG